MYANWAVGVLSCRVSVRRKGSYLAGWVTIGWTSLYSHHTTQSLTYDCSKSNDTKSYTSLHTLKLHLSEIFVFMAMMRSWELSNWCPCWCNQKTKLTKITHQDYKQQRSIKVTCKSCLSVVFVSRSYIQKNVLHSHKCHTGVIY